MSETNGREWGGKAVVTTKRSSKTAAALAKSTKILGGPREEMIFDVTTVIGDMIVRHSRSMKISRGRTRDKIVDVIRGINLDAVFELEQKKRKKDKKRKNKKVKKS